MRRGSLRDAPVSRPAVSAADPLLTQPEDHDLAGLLPRVAEGDHAAYEELYRRSAALLYGVCRRVLPETAEAEEAFQDALLAAWRRAGSFDPAKGTAIGWLVTIARNCAIDRMRAGTRHQGAPIATALGVEDPQEPADDAIAWVQEQARLQACLAELADQDHRLVRSAYLQNLPYLELARREAMPLGTIKTRIRRALLKLRECLG